MARPVSRARRGNGSAPLHVLMPADLRDRLARAAFEAGEPVSAAVARAVKTALDAEGAPPPAHDVPQARWTDMGGAGWWAQDVPCPAGGANLKALPGEAGWLPRVEIGAALLDGPQLRSRTAAMLEAEALAAALTPERLAEGPRRPVRRRA